MLDARLRPIIDPPLGFIARLLAPHISANAMTTFGFICGVLCFIFIAIGSTGLAGASVYFLLASRLADGLDGAIARINTEGGTDWGGYADIVADFLLWSFLPLAFIILNPANASAAAVLLSAFAMSMVVFLAFAVMAEKRGLATDAQGRKSFFYIAGLAEGAETIAFFVIVCLAPSLFIPAAYLFAVLVYLSVIGRIITTYAALKNSSM